jgi:hypothetical protein
VSGPVTKAAVWAATTLDGCEDVGLIRRGVTLLADSTIYWEIRLGVRPMVLAERHLHQ